MTIWRFPDAPYLVIPKRILAQRKVDYSARALTGADWGGVLGRKIVILAYGWERKRAHTAWAGVLTVRHAEENKVSASLPEAMENPQVWAGSV